MEELESTGKIRDEKGRFIPGVSGNLNGRPEGSVSVITEIKRIFRENPDKFEDFLEKYLKNPNNEKHIAEMIDGKPMQRNEISGVNGSPLTVEIISYKDEDTPTPSV